MTCPAWCLALREGRGGFHPRPPYPPARELPLEGGPRAGGSCCCCASAQGRQSSSFEQGIFLVGTKCVFEACDAAHRGVPQHHPLRPDWHAEVVQQDRARRGARALLPLPRARLHRPERGPDPERAVQPESVSPAGGGAVSTAHGPRAPLCP